LRLSAFSSLGVPVRGRGFPPFVPPPHKGEFMSEEKMSVDELLLAIALDPVLFVEAILQANPEEWQKKALYAVRDNDRVAIRSGHGIGKTAFLSWLILWWVLTRSPSRIACTANTASQLSDILWAEVAKWHRRMPDGLKELIEVKSDKVELTGQDSFAVARTARRETPEALQGFHSPNMLFLIDEASGVDDIIFEVGEGAMSTEGAKTVMTGNPTRTSGYFYEAFNKVADRWFTMKVASSDSTQVGKSFIEDMKLKYGEDSNIYRVRVLGEWPEADDDVVIPLHLLQSAADRDQQAAETTPVVWGLDVARFGTDKTALCKRKGNVVTEPIKTWRNKDLMEICGIILNEYETTRWSERPAEILVDSIGLGAGVVDRLMELDLPVRGINVAESPAMGERYGRLRDELWFLAKEWFESRDCKIPEQEELISDLSKPRFKFTSNGKLKVESKDEMKRRGLNSPDLADSFCLTFGSTASVAKSGSAYKWNRPLNYSSNKWVV
jgi:phage terminase large subunit